VLIVVLTAKGKSVIKAYSATCRAIVEFMSTLDPDEQKFLGDLCRKLGNS